MRVSWWSNLRRVAAGLPGASPERSRDEAAVAEERLAQMGALLIGTVHELSSPLTTMAVLVEELRQRPDAGDRRELAESLRIVSAQIDLCRTILSRLPEQAQRVSILAATPAGSSPHDDGAEARPELRLSTGA